MIKGNAVDMVRETFSSGAFLMKAVDGWARASIPVTNSRQLYDWLLQHGDESIAEGPESVKNELAKRLEELRRAYQ